MTSWISAEAMAQRLAPLLERYDVKGRGHGVIYVDHEPHNIVTAQVIVADLSASFDVPQAQVRERLVELGLLKDVRGDTPAPEPSRADEPVAPSRFAEGDEQDDEITDAYEDD